MTIWTSWRRHFESNALRPFPHLPRVAILSREMIASLQIFQLGETGEGRVVQQVKRMRSSAIDDDYREALALFVKEEGRHARILSGILASAGAKPLKASASASAFTAVRGLIGVRFKLVVLLAAEIVAIEAYPILAAASNDARVAALLEHIAEDERSHLRFHTDFFRRALHRVGTRVVFAPLLLMIVGAAAALCAYSHRRTWQHSAWNVFARMVRRAVTVVRDVYSSPSKVSSTYTGSSRMKSAPGVRST